MKTVAITFTHDLFDFLSLACRSDEECDDAVIGDGLKKRNKVYPAPWRSQLANDLMNHVAFGHRPLAKERIKGVKLPLILLVHFNNHMLGVSMLFDAVMVPSKRLTSSKITETEWIAFIKEQRDQGHGWAIADFEQFRHLIPQSTPSPPLESADSKPDDNMKLDRDAKREVNDSQSNGNSCE